MVIKCYLRLVTKMEDSQTSRGVRLRRLPQRPARLATTIVRDLIDEIVSGGIAPGDVLPSESVLAEEFRVSRIVVREALKALEERGVLVVRQGAGTVVDLRSRWNMLDPDVLDAIIRYDPSERVLENLVSVRASLESELAEAAAARGSIERWNEMRLVVDRMKSTTQDPTAFEELDRLFHSNVIEAADNEIAAAVVSRIHFHALASSNYPRNASADRLLTSAREHQHILDFLVARDGAEASRAMKAHIIDSWARRR